MSSKKKSSAEITRRDLIKISSSALALGGLGGTSALLSTNAFGQDGEKSALVVIFLAGGYNALFSSPASFMNQSFGVNATNTFLASNQGNTLLLDRSFFGLSDFAKAHIATVGVLHGINIHESAQRAQFAVQATNPAITIANAMKGSAASKIVNIGTEMIPNGSGIQRINDIQTFLDTLGNNKPDPTMPKRELAAKAISQSEAMSKQKITNNPGSLVSASDSYGIAVATLSKPPQVFNPEEVRTAYGLNGTAIQTFRHKMAAAELAIRAGTNVVTIATGFVWDSHGDVAGAGVRNRFQNEIKPGLDEFSRRMIGDAQNPFKVTVVILGDFARSLPGSDHGNGTVATVFGPNIKVGTTGQVGPDVRFQASTPGARELWGFLAAAVGAPSEVVQSFGGNQHPSLLLR